MDRSKPGFPVLHYLLEFSKTQVHCINYATQPSHPLLIQLVHWVWCWNWDTRISFLLWPPCLVILPALAGGLFTTGTTWEAPYMFYLNLIESKSCSVMSDSLQPHGLYNPWNSVGQNTGVGSLSHLQGIFPTQGLNPGLPHCRWILYQLSHKGSPRILEWVAYPFSSGSSWPGNWTRVSCIAGGLFTNWAMREVLKPNYSTSNARPSLQSES